ncbi:MAG: hypothetical protein E7253_09260 [Lachnospiraceae bacterium]|nr:hypothetical protein [Lachnospiraceae bacterium]
MHHEIRLFLLGTATGVLLSVFYDLFRALRRSKKHPDWAVAFEDLFFWLTAAGCIFILFQKFNKGVLRLYVFLGCMIGIFCYFQTITKLVFPVFLMIFKIIQGILYKCCLIFEIIRKIFKNFVILPLKNIWEKIRIIYNNI